MRYPARSEAEEFVGEAARWRELLIRGVLYRQSLARFPYLPVVSIPWLFLGGGGGERRLLLLLLLRWRLLL
jgi:hypothetical protein